MLGPGNDAVLDLQPEIPHRFAPAQRPHAHQVEVIVPHRVAPREQAASPHPPSDTALQPRGMQYTDDGEERLVERGFTRRRSCRRGVGVGNAGGGEGCGWRWSPFVLVLVLVLPFAFAFPGFVGIGIIVLRWLWRWWLWRCSSVISFARAGCVCGWCLLESGEVGVALGAGVFGYAEVVVRLARGFGVRVVQ